VVNLGKWYDPISERWIAPREPRLEAASPQTSENPRPGASEDGRNPAHLARARRLLRTRLMLARSRGRNPSSIAPLVPA